MLRNLDRDIADWRKFWQNCTDLEQLDDNLNQVEMALCDVEDWAMRLEELAGEYRERIQEIEDSE